MILFKLSLFLKGSSSFSIKIRKKGKKILFCSDLDRHQNEMNPMYCFILTYSVDATDINDNINHITTELVGLHIDGGRVGCNIDLNYYYSHYFCFKLNIISAVHTVH